MMKNILIFFLFIMFNYAGAQTEYEDFFTNDALRIDFTLAGNHERESLYFGELKKENHWAGPRNNYLAPFNYGNYRIQVKSERGNLIYKRGFSTLFEEFQSTAFAKEEKKSFYQTIRIPYPKDTVTITVQKRMYETGKFITLAEKKIDPFGYFINREGPPKVDYEQVLHSGPADKKVDLVFLAEGYTGNEMGAFIDDVNKTIDYIFDQKPFTRHKNNFNIYAVKSVSSESGTDVPGEKIYKRTALNTGYYTFDIPRYLTTSDTKSIRNFASVVPYDHIIILINTNRYGGGGFYNHYTAATSDHAYSMEVAIHELGHGFAGLGDEYYSSSVAYSDFYNTEVEPWEPNLTTLVDFENKWKEMLGNNIPIPTPRKEKYRDTIGVFEGGGYVAEGVYSPAMDCRMKSNVSMGFCPVCRKAIEKMILFYTDSKK